MLGKFFTHLRQQWMGGLALFLVLTGGSAYALTGSNTVFSDDIVDGEVKTGDVHASAVNSSKIGDGQVQSADIGSGQVLTGEIATGGVRSADVLNDNLTGGDVAPNSLKGADVDESSLAGPLIPGIATSGLVKSSGIVAVDTDEVKPLLSAGPFTVRGHCETIGPSRVAAVRITSSVDNWSVDSDADRGNDEGTDLTSVTSWDLASTSLTVDKELDVGDYAAAAPNGKLLGGEAVAGANIMGHACVFGVTGIG